MCEFNQNTYLSWSSKSHCSWHHFTSDLPFVPHAPCAKCCFSDWNRYNLDIECNQGKYCFLLLLTEIILRKYVRILKIQMIRKLILRDLFPSKSINALLLPKVTSWNDSYCFRVLSRPITFPRTFHFILTSTLVKELSVCQYQSNISGIKMKRWWGLCCKWIWFSFVYFVYLSPIAILRRYDGPIL